jgi:hypothetical protein
MLVHRVREIPVERELDVRHQRIDALMLAFDGARPRRNEGESIVELRTPPA